MLPKQRDSSYSDISSEEEEEEEEEEA